jgi:1-acyl-sn-glycerol-3-phosphate acyltransferase
MGGAIFINRGQVDRKALKQARLAINEGCVFGLAPEGTRSRVGALIRARDGAAYLATRSIPQLLPIGVVNTDRLGYNMAHLRKTEMQVVIGKAFTLPDIGKRPRGDELAAFTHLIMVHIAALLPKRHWGYYANSPALKALLAGEDPWPRCLIAEGVSLQLDVAD